MFLLLYPNKIITRLVLHMIRVTIIIDGGNRSGPEIIYQPTIEVIPNNITPSAINPLVFILFFGISVGIATSYLEKSV